MYKIQFQKVDPKSFFESSALSVLRYNILTISKNCSREVRKKEIKGFGTRPTIYQRNGESSFTKLSRSISGLFPFATLILFVYDMFSFYCTKKHKL